MDAEAAYADALHASIVKPKKLRKHWIVKPLPPPPEPEPSDALVRDVLILRRHYMSLPEIALHFGLTVAEVRAIVVGRRND